MLYTNIKKVSFFLRPVSDVDISFCNKWKRCLIITSVTFAIAIVAIAIAIALTLGGGQQGTK
jgi:hypothetical protein